MEVTSYLDEPFKGILTLEAVDPKKIADIRFTLANQAYYQSLGLTKPAFLDKTRFRLGSSTEKGHVLYISTRGKVINPVLNLIIRAEQKSNEIVQKYTLLLEPRSGDSAFEMSNMVETKHLQIDITAGQQKILQADNSENSLGRTILVAPKQSISIIAQESQLHETYSVYQVMRAFYLVNKPAFENGNINRLISGSSLRIPVESLINELTRLEAIEFVKSVSMDIPAETNDIEYIQPETVVSVTKTESEEVKVIPNLTLVNLRSLKKEAERFTTLSTVMKTQNGAMRSILDDIDLQQEKIIRLEDKIKNLQWLPLSEPINEIQNSVSEPAVNPEQAEVISQLNRTIELLKGQIVEKDIKIQKLSVQLEALTNIQKSSQAKAQLPSPQINGSEQSPAVNLPAQPSRSESKSSISYNLSIIIVLILILIAVIILVMVALKRGWQNDYNRPFPKSETRRPNYQPSLEDMEESELRNIEVLNKGENQAEMGDVAQAKLKSGKIYDFGAYFKI